LVDISSVITDQTFSFGKRKGREGEGEKKKKKKKEEEGI
jgi:hypothetical protein